MEIDLIKSKTTKELEHTLSCLRGEIETGVYPPKAITNLKNIEEELSLRQTQVVEKDSLGPSPHQYPLEYRTAVKYKNLYDSALRRNKEFDLSFSDVKKLLCRKTCSYTGVKFSSSPESPHHRTIDRLDPNLGYVKGNVYAVTHIANSVKNALFENSNDVRFRMNLSEVTKMCSTLASLEFKENRTQ